MSAFLFSAQVPEIALPTATGTTAVQIVAPANHRLKVVRWFFGFDGIDTSGEPVQLRVLRQTSAGTMSALTPVKVDPSLSETIQSTAQHTATAEPTPGDVLESYEIHPQSGMGWIYPLGQEIVIGGGGRLGFEFTAPASVRVRGYVILEE